ncbi:MAG: 4-(cytidine 5'-diphospho)-2-C-methyl-D-erythritol kinase, partial [Novosphingobium sp.]|nr:4-(cytidine 5'-diphospho)-2-C-methyl-D-erythritol kinase [Novosphingobium sp.]
MIETAWAKINLALHVRRRREDGYHEIETLFAFVDAGDRLTARPAVRDTVSVCGQFAGQIGGDARDNLVARALSALPHPQGLAIVLEKNLPVAAGLGGGSADAGAVFRIVRRLCGLPEDWRERAGRLGADVPACVYSRMAIGRGIGTELEPVENDLAGMCVLLVNPRISLPTAPVFAGWNGIDAGPMPCGTAQQIALNGRNDLEASAIAILSVITEVREA